MVLYFWGIALTTQGFFTLVLTTGPDTMHYWLFWANHTIVVGLAVYEVAVLGYRPRLGDVGAAIGFTALWVAMVLPLNMHYGWNYGYLNEVRLGTQSLLDGLGDWPLRLVWMELLVIAGFVVVWALRGLLRMWKAQGGMGNGIIPAKAFGLDRA
jgi:uncharacterized membrane protein YwaF